MGAMRQAARYYAHEGAHGSAVTHVTDAKLQGAGANAGAHVHADELANGHEHACGDGVVNAGGIMHANEVHDVENESMLNPSALRVDRLA